MNVQERLRYIKTRLKELSFEATTKPGALKQVEINYLEKQRSPEDFPNGICIPFSRFLQLCRGGLGIFKPYDVAGAYQYLPSIFSDLDEAGYQVFKSGVTDIAQLALTGASIGHLTTRIIPWAHSHNMYEINRKAEQNNPSELIKLNAVVAEKLVTGPDIDGKINIAPDKLPEWFDGLIAKTIETYNIPQKDVIKQVTETSQLTKIFFSKRTVHGWQLGSIGEDHHPNRDTVQVPYLEFERGTWQSGIPYINIRYVGHPFHEKTKDHAKDTVWIDIEASPHPSLLPPELQDKDTRTGDQINSHNKVFAPVSLKPKTLSSKLPFDELPPDFKDWFGERFFVNFGSKNTGYLEHGGIFIPVFQDHFDENGVYTIETNNSFPSPELWIYLSQEGLKKIAEPITFGSKFGIRVPQETFLEFLRTLRYSLRVGKPIKEDFIKDQAFKIITGEKDIQDPPLPEKIKTLMQKEGLLSWWHIDTIREVATSLFFAPKEFIETGRQFDFSKYFPRWNILEAIYDKLPSRKELINTLLGNANRVAYGYDKNSFEIIAEEVKKAFPKDKNIHQMNPLELVFWLSSLQ